MVPQKLNGSYVTRKVEVKNLLLDPDNPRFLHLDLEGEVERTQEMLEKEINKDQQTISLLKAIRRSGVKDPIWVQENGKGKYIVFEGNRRTVVLRTLLQEKITPPPGIEYDKVDAYVYPENAEEVEIALMKVRLQTGKKNGVHITKLL